ncbi:MAG TPA: hypothetical protein PKD68_04280 [Candidatus Saccharibacteria bacterium]|nr:hypothetical protein [Candidatus Saccharibacteria bacterium]
MARNHEEYTNKLLLAQLSIEVDKYIRETGIARLKPRSIDQMLVDVGLEPSDIGRILGKTERAVYKQLAANSKSVKKAKDTEGQEV